MSILERIKNLLEPQLEDFNFRVDSTNWNIIIVNEQRYRENKEKDIWELLDYSAKGEQLFTWEAAMRETKKAGKRLPTDEEFSRLLRTKKDMKNIVFTGEHNEDGRFRCHGKYADFWSSSQTDYDVNDAWIQYLIVSNNTATRTTGEKTKGFLVRCLK